MPDHHYHANHVDAPARGARATAERDARALRLLAAMYAEERDGWLVDPRISGFALVVTCHRPDCRIKPRDERI